MKKQKISLALGSGGNRGWVHIGVIKSLIKNNFEIEAISGASAGSIVGAYYAIYGEVESLEDYAIKNNNVLLPLFLDFGIKDGIINGDKIDKFLKEILKEEKFSKTKIPLYIIATDLMNGQTVTIKSGNIADAVRGSISIPLVFKPMAYKNTFLGDGGMSDPVPVNILKKENPKSKILAVNLYHEGELNDKKPNLSNIILKSFRIMLYNLSKGSTEEADLVINPDTSKLLNEVKIKDSLKPEIIKKLIKLGENETDKIIPKLKDICK